MQSSNTTRYVSSDDINYGPAWLQLMKQVKSGAGWFYWIAGLSFVNTVASYLDLNAGFAIGLGATQFVDGIAYAIASDVVRNVSVLVTAAALVIDLLILGFFALFGLLANKRKKWAFVVGIAVYALDGVIYLLVKEWIGLGFHAFALYGIVSGLLALRKLEKLEAGVHAALEAE